MLTAGKNNQNDANDDKDKDDAQKYALVLEDIDLRAAPGELVMVIGPVGCGKSSLLKSMLGLLHKQAGNVRKRGRVGYIPQESFLINNTFRANVVFGHEFDEDKYRRAIRISQLEPDLDVIKGGEFAEIGEKGLNLSGGQKQRISIARAVYAEADIVLVDDSLSALDAHVGKKIFTEVFMNQFVRRGKTVIMCTHVLEYLDVADRVVFVQNGRVTCQGSYEELRDGDPDFRVFVDDEKKRKQSSRRSLGDDEDQDDQDNQNDQNGQRRRFDYSAAVFDEFPADDGESLSEQIRDEVEQFMSIADADESHGAIQSSRDVARSARQLSLSLSRPVRKQTQQGQQDQQVQEGKLTKREKQLQGDIKRDVFWRYFRAGGVCLFVMNHLFIILMVLAKIFVDFWVGSWTNNTFGFAPDVAQLKYMLGYGGIILGMMLVGAIQAVLWARYSTNAGIRIFRELLANVMKKPMSYFDTTPIGQILNLLGKDTDLVDALIPNALLGVVINSYQFVGIVALASVSNVVLVPIVAVIFVFMSITIRSYLNLQRETKRLELLLSSPIISNIVELYNGLVVFRNYGKVGYIRSMYQENINKRAQITVHSRYVGAMMQAYTEMVMAVFIGCTYLLITLGVVYEWSFIPRNISILSVTLNWVITIPSFINFFLFRYAIFIQYMGSTERIFYNVDDAVLEGNYALPQPIYSASFPSKGEIEVKNIKVRYREGLPLVLDGVSFVVAPKEKIGIVGRTGSGKSSLLLALTRMINVENSRFYKLVEYDQKLGEFQTVDKKKTPRPSAEMLKSGAYMRVQDFTPETQRQNLL